MLYHGSSMSNLNILKPFASDHNEPYVYLTDNEVIACIYTVHILPKPYNWFTYGFCNRKPVYTEFFPNALRLVYKGKSGYIYSADEFENAKKLKEINGVYISEEEVKIKETKKIADVYEKLLQYEKEGKLIIERYELLSDIRKEKIKSIIKSEIIKYNLKDNFETDYAKFIRTFFPDVWANITIL